MEDRRKHKAAQKVEWAGNSRARQEKRGKQASKKSGVMLAAMEEDENCCTTAEHEGGAEPLTADQLAERQARRVARAKAQQERLAEEWAQLAAAEEAAQQRKSRTAAACSASEATRAAKLQRKRENRRNRKDQVKEQRTLAAAEEAEIALAQGGAEVSSAKDGANMKAGSCDTPAIAKPSTASAASDNFAISTARPLLLYIVAAVAVAAFASLSFNQGLLVSRGG